MKVLSKIQIQHFFEHFHNYFSKGLYWDSSFKNSILGLDFQAQNVGRSGRLNPNWHDL